MTVPSPLPAPSGVLSVQRSHSPDRAWWSARVADAMARASAFAHGRDESVDLGPAPVERLVGILRAAFPDLALAATSSRCEQSAVLFTAADGRTLLVEVHDENADVSAWAAEDPVARALSKSALEALPRSTAVGDAVPFTFWHWKTGRNEADADLRDVACPSLAEISPNYVPRVLEELERLAALEQPDAGGKMVLWFGPPGTGKTYAVRALARAWATRLGATAEVVVDPEALFARSEYLHEVLLSEARPKRIAEASRRRLGLPEVSDSGPPLRLIVLEDAAELFSSGCRATQGFARFLNLTEGIVGQGLRCVFLLTTNEEIGRLDAALTRPGRCLQALEFAPFDEEEARAWLVSRGLPAEGPGGSRTLAELFAVSAAGSPALQAVGGRIGF